MKHMTRWAMLNLVLMTLLALVTVAVVVSGQSSATGSPLVGAWRVTETVDANGAAITNPQPGLYIFAKQHYSFTRIQGTKPLPNYPSNDKARAARRGSMRCPTRHVHGDREMLKRSHGGKRVRHWRCRKPVDSMDGTPRLTRSRRAS